MDKQNQISKSRSKDTDSSKQCELISRWLVRFALNADKPLTPREQGIMGAAWEEAFADVDLVRLEAAFLACYRAHTFKTIPTVGDIRKHLARAEQLSVEADAHAEWDRVLRYANSTSPDYASKPLVASERTKTAIRAAGGIDWIRDCSESDLQWAQKRFIESCEHWAELEQDQYLLPDGEIKDLIQKLADSKRLPS